MIQNPYDYRVQLFTVWSGRGMFISRDKELIMASFTPKPLHLAKNMNELNSKSSGSKLQGQTAKM